MEWLRLYTDILDDEKIAQLSDNQYRIFTFLMLMASENDLGGVVTQGHQAIAWRLRMPVNRIKSAIEKLEALNIISNENNTITFLNWHKRQYKSDNSTERVKRFRNKQETLPPTLENRTEQIQNRTDTEAEASGVVMQPVDNSNGEEKSFFKNPLEKKKHAFMQTLQEAILETQEKYPDPWEQRAILLFVEANIRNKHPDAVLHCIKSLTKAPEKIRVINKYLEAVLKIENGKYHASDSEEECNAYKADKNPFADLLASIGKPIQ